MKMDVLKQSYKDKSLIGIRTDKLDWEETIIGFIVGINNNSVTINEIDENGFHIGITEIEINDINSIDLNDRYQKRLLFLHDNVRLLDVSKKITVWKEADDLIPYFKELIIKKKIVTLYFNDDNYFTGVISKLDKFYLMINAIGREGDEDGVSFFTIERIKGLSYNGIEEQKIELLNKNLKRFY